MKNRDITTIEKIIEYCDLVNSLIEEYGEDFMVFQSKKSFQLSTSMCIIQIGEYVNRLSPEFKNEHDNIPWRKIKGMRNFTTHKYEHVDLDVIWYAITVEIPELKEQLLLLI